MPKPIESAMKIAKDLREHPKLAEITEQGYVHTETYGVRNEIWYMLHDDGRFHFYYVDRDAVTSSKPLIIHPFGNGEKVPEKAPMELHGPREDEPVLSDLELFTEGGGI